MTTKHELSLNELSAEIRNKLQTPKTILELLKVDRKVPHNLIDKALQDLEKVEDLIS